MVSEDQLWKVVFVHYIYINHSFYLEPTVRFWFFYALRHHLAGKGRNNLVFIFDWRSNCLLGGCLQVGSSVCLSCVFEERAGTKFSDLIFRITPSFAFGHGLFGLEHIDLEQSIAFGEELSLWILFGLDFSVYILFAHGARLTEWENIYLGTL